MCTGIKINYDDGCVMGRTMVYQLGFQDIDDKDKRQEFFLGSDFIVQKSKNGISENNYLNRN